MPDRRLRCALAACAATLLLPPLQAQAKPVLCGIDVLQRDGFAPLRGQRVGLITNHTGRSRDGTTTLDLFLHSENVRLVAIFSPEHGVAGRLDEKVGDSTHASGLPVYSLYGETRQPTAAQLEGVDTLVFDIQDVGCRFYTYVSTMGLSMQAAAAHGKAFVVLDRPNPIGGTEVEGPVLDAGKESFVGWHVLPVRHGMTAGELARMFAAEKGIHGELEVVALEGWEGRRSYDLCDLAWVNPSPNMRSLTEAFLYPGVGLLEFTNLSVGRGTDTPFEVIGAPWLDGVALARRLHAAEIPGVTFVPVRFTPTASKFKGESCGGVQIAITDRAAYRALPLGFGLACALRAQHAEQWDCKAYARLLLDDATFAALQAGKPWREVLAVGADELAAFVKRRESFLLYR
ncbi:MAG: DUF1343 domain-containing protein [Planctomycetota bacterium]